MTKYIMLDIETTGIEKTDSILQIGLLECIKNNKGYYVPARTFNKTIHFDEVITNKWILIHHEELLKVCKTTEYVDPAIVRALILGFFMQCGMDTPPSIMGVNIGGFDLPFMHRAGFLKPVDHHYRTYELNGAYKLAGDVLGLESKELFEQAQNACDWITLPTGKKHEAMYDCYNQLKTLNGIIKLLQQNVLTT